MASLAMRGFILGAPKPNSIQLPSCNSYQQKAMVMLQTQRHRRHGMQISRRNISRSFIVCAKKPGSGKGPKINQAPTSEQLSVSSSSISNSERSIKKSKGSEVNATPTQTSQ